MTDPIPPKASQSPPPIMGEGLVEYVAALLWFKTGATTRWEDTHPATQDNFRALARRDLAALATPSLPEGME